METMVKLFSRTILFLIVIFFLRIPSAGAIAEIADGSFENFDETWECDINCTRPVLDYFVYPSSIAVDGYAYAYLFHDAGMFQNLIVPTNATSLDFAYDNQNDDEVPEEGTFTVYVIDVDSGDTYAEQSFNEQSDTWIVGSVVIPENALGKNVQLWFSNNTGFNRIDALQFATIEDQVEDSGTDPEKVTVRE